MGEVPLVGIYQLWDDSDQREIMRYVGKVDDKGRLSVPKQARELVGWTKGAWVSVFVEGSSLRVSSPREEAERLRGFVKHVHAGRDLAAELIEERREEAARENAASAKGSSVP